MKKRIILAAALLAGSAAFAAVEVKTERLATPDATWKFTTVPGPSKSDIAQSAMLTVTAGSLDGASGQHSVLVNGKLPADPKDLGQETFFHDGGTLVLDLGKIQPVAAVNTYSWHEFPADQGARGPQVYTLSGAAKEGEWRKLADVDTRPNPTGENWGGRYGASVTDTRGKLGDFRYLKFDIQPTRSPKQGNRAWTNTLFAEIDVHAAATLAKAGDAVIAAPIKTTDVFVVIKSHFDLGFTDQAANVFHRYRTEMMDLALLNMAKTEQLPKSQQFVWTVPGWPMKKMLEPEGMVRSLGFASKLARDVGKPLPTSQAGVTVSRPGVFVTAFGQNPDGEGTLLRLWEQAGTAGELIVTLGAPSACSVFSTVTPVNLRGEKTGEPLKIKRGKLTFALHAYAPASFVLE